MSGVTILISLRDVRVPSMVWNFPGIPTIRAPAQVGVSTQVGLLWWAFRSLTSMACQYSDPQSSDAARCRALDAFFNSFDAVARRRNLVIHNTRDFLRRLRCLVLLDCRFAKKPILSIFPGNSSDMSAAKDPDSFKFPIHEVEASSQYLFSILDSRHPQMSKYSHYPPERIFHEFC